MTFDSMRGDSSKVVGGTRIALTSDQWRRLKDLLDTSVKEARDGAFT